MPLPSRPQLASAHSPPLVAPISERPMPNRSSHSNSPASASSSGSRRPARLPRLAIIVSRYNATVTDRLLQGAVLAYQRAGGRVQDLYIAEAPGSFELVPLSAAAATCGEFAGVLALGCIIKGETRHDEFLGHAVTQGLANISIMTGIPVGLGVLTVNTPRQAEERAGIRGNLGNKGAEAMEALIATVGELLVLRDPAALRRVIAQDTGHKLMQSMPVRPDKLAPRAPAPARAKSRSGKGAR